MVETQKHSLREGFTTGTAASAAAYAAVTALLGGPLPASAPVDLPPFSQIGGKCEGSGLLDILIDQGGSFSETIAWAEVVKDGGDDPDSTHGVRIRACASRSPFPVPSLPGSVLRPESSENKSVLPAIAGPLKIACDQGMVFLYAGVGIGIATLPGLPVAVGEPAINPEPRKQIAHAVCKAARQNGYEGSLHILISTEDGEQRARHTLNARLGILGGISILGTRGTVRPYSSEAWKETIRQGLNVARALGLESLLLSTGRRSERLGFGLYPELPPQAGIQAADFAAFTLRKAVAGPFKHLNWICFPGKLLKLAQGLEWTHAREAAADTGMLARLCAEEGGSPALLRELEAFPTAAGAFGLMQQKNPDLHDAVLRRLAEKAYAVMHGWIEVERPGWFLSGRLSLHVFSLEGTALLSMEETKDLCGVKANLL